MASQNWNQEKFAQESSSPVFSPERHIFRNQRSSINFPGNPAMDLRKKSLSSVYTNPVQFEQDPLSSPYVEDCRFLEDPSPSVNANSIQNFEITDPRSLTNDFEESNRSLMRTIMFSCQNMANMFENTLDVEQEGDKTKLKNVTKFSKSKMVQFNQFLMQNELHRKNYYNIVKGNISQHFDERKESILALQKKIQKNKQKMMRRAGEIQYGRFDGY